MACADQCPGTPYNQLMVQGGTVSWYRITCVNDECIATLIPKDQWAANGITCDSAKSYMVTARYSAADIQTILGLMGCTTVSNTCPPGSTGVYPNCIPTSSTGGSVCSQSGELAKTLCWISKNQVYFGVAAVALFLLVMGKPKNVHF